MPAPDFSAIPAALRERAQWLCWRLEQKPNAKKPAKMPYYASGRRRTGVQGSDEDRAALVTFDAAVAALAAIKADGIGFAFLPDDGLIGIDLDKMVDAESGEISPRAQRIIEACASYTEWSPSGNGFHIYVLGTTATAKDNGIGVEMFCGRQFFTVTGKHLTGTPAEVTAIDEKVLRRLQKTIELAKGGFSDKPPAAPRQPSAPPVASPPLSSSEMTERERIQSALDAIDPGVGYEDWVQIGMALHSALPSEGLALWDAWSARSDKYAGAHDVQMHWKSFKPGRVGVATLFHHAKAHGWKPPRRPRGRKNGSIPQPGACAGTDDQQIGWRWRFGLWRTDAGNPKPIRENVEHLLMEHPDLTGLVGYNVFAHRLEKRIDPPWKGGTGEWKPQDTRELASWIASTARISGLKLKDVGDAVALVAWRSLMNPVRELFEAQPAWDGIERLDHWLIECCGALDTPYIRLVGRKFIMGIVKRVFDPGCKFDYMLIFEGEQGRGKSSAARVLAWRDEWFADTPFSANLDKDARLALHGCLIYEVSEMHGFNRADAAAIKAFISQMDDKLRAPYAEQHEVFRRSMVFIGTTNETEYFRDRTGNRRFWPVAVRLVDIEKLKEWRAQLFAEALHRIRAGEAIYPSRDEESALCRPEQEKRLVIHPWADFIAYWLGLAENEALRFVPWTRIFVDALKIEPSRISPFGSDAKEIGHIMKSLGWEPARDRVNGVQMRGFKRTCHNQENGLSTDQATDMKGFYDNQAPF